MMRSLGKVWLKIRPTKKLGKTFLEIQKIILRRGKLKERLTLQPKLRKRGLQKNRDSWAMNA